MNDQRCGDGRTFPALHRASHALMLAFAPAAVPEMETETRIKQGREDVGQKLNYNVRHS